MYEQASHDDLVQIFAETVILYQKKPFLVKGIAAERALVMSNLDDLNKKVTVRLESPDLDFTPVPLGFCNHNKDAFYISRMPRRQYKQGLSKGSVSVKPITKDASMAGIADVGLCKGRSIAHCILGNFPSLQEAVKRLKDDAFRSVAINRKWAIDKDFALYFRTSRVGIVDGDTLKPVFSRSQGYLKELFNARAAGG